MPQGLLPLLPSGTTPINNVISVHRENKRWTYFYGLLPVFFHDEGELATFRMFTAQLVCQGTCKQSEIVRTFGVSKNSVSRSVKKYREEGAKGFF